MTHTSRIRSGLARLGGAMLLALPAAASAIESASLSVLFPGMSGVHVAAWVADGEPGSVSGSRLARSTWQRDGTTLRVPPALVDVEIRHGNGPALVVDEVDCSEGSCTVDGLTAKLSVQFEGMSSVHTAVLVPDGVEGEAEGARVTYANWRNGSAEMVVLRQLYDLRIQRGGATVIVDGVDCTSGSCSVGDLTAKIHVSFPGLSSVHTDARVPDDEPGVAAGDEVARSNWRTDKADLTVFRGEYDVRVRHGAATYVLDGFSCTAATCSIEGLTAKLTVRFEGMSSVHTEARVTDAQPGVATGGAAGRANWKSNRAELTLLRGRYDLAVRHGGATRVIDDVDCDRAECDVGELTTTMRVVFDGMSSVHTEILVPDDALGTADGASVARSNWRRNAAEIALFRGRYDVRVEHGAATRVIDDQDCTGATCTVDGLTAELTVKFDGMSSVHTDARVPDGTAGAATGAEVAHANWKSGQAVLMVLRGRYDVRVRRGGATHVIDDLDCEQSACDVGNLSTPMLVRFAGLSSVHTDARVPDGAPGVAAGDEVARANWKRDAAELVVFPGRYDVRIRQGGTTLVVDAFECTRDSCTIDELSAEMVVRFPGMSSVHTVARVPDGEAGVAGGEKVARAHWRSDEAQLMVLRGRYDVSVSRGGATRVFDDLDCRNSACAIDGFTATMSVHFEGMSSVHTGVLEPDGKPGVANGAEVTHANWKSGHAEIQVFEGSYDVRVRHGAAALVVDDFACSAESCAIDGLTSKMSVQFDGIKSVHTDAWLPDGEPGSIGDDKVAHSNWKSHETSLTLLRGLYDVRVRQGAGQLVTDSVDCTGASCEVDDLTAALTIEFPGLSKVHSEARVPDGVAGAADGPEVARARYKSHAASLTVLRGEYDVRVQHGSTTVFDEVACTGESCSAVVMGNAQITLRDGDSGSPIAGQSLYVYRKSASGSLYLAQKGRTSEDGLVHFTLDGLASGSVFVAKTYNAFALRKTYYSPLITRAGAFEFEITREGDYPLDDDPPQIAIASPATGSSVPVGGFTVSGSTRDDNAVTGVRLTIVDPTLGTSTVDAVLAVDGSSWSADVVGTLVSTDATVLITATATDRARNEASTSVSVRVIEDTMAPLVAFLSHASGDRVEATGFLVRGVVSDDTTVATLLATLVDPQRGTVFEDREVAFDATLGNWAVAVGNGEVTVGDDPVTLSLTATDSQGNARSESIDLVVEPGDDLAAHMVSRTTFGLTPALANEVASLGALGFLAQQLDPDALGEDIDPGFEPTTKEELQHYILLHMIESPKQLVEVMAWFWDNHFSTDVDKPGNTVAYELQEYREFRANALGNFVDLLLISAQSPAMIYYLDNISNTFVDANENYTREVMELHTMGVDGGYTPEDIESGAELFTGWHAAAGAFFFDATQHNPDPQTVLATTFPAAGADGGLSRGEDLLTLLASQRATAEFICTKLVRFLVDDVAPMTLVDRCADTFQGELAEDDQIARVLEEILTSAEFAGAARSKLKTPIDFVVGTVRALEASGDGTDLAGAVAALGLELNGNPVPTGYSVLAPDWVSTNLLVERIRWVNALARAPSGGEAAHLEPAAYFQAHRVTTREGIVGFLSALLFDDDLTDLERSTAAAVLDEGGDFDINAVAADTKLRRALGTMLGYPSYQYK